MATPVLVNGNTGVLADALFVRGTDCDVAGYHIFNASNATAFVQFYKGIPAPTVGTTVPDWVVGIPTLEQAFMSMPVAGLFFKGGLWVAATTALAGTTPPSAALVVSLAIT